MHICWLDARTRAPVLSRPAPRCADCAALLCLPLAHSWAWGCRAGGFLFLLLDALYAILAATISCLRARPGLPAEAWVVALGARLGCSHRCRCPRVGCEAATPLVDMSRDQRERSRAPPAVTALHHRVLAWWVLEGGRGRRQRDYADMGRSFQ